MKRFLLVIFCVLAFPVMASHIVGGEFEIVYLSKNYYRINLILYFDKKNGNPQAQDPSVTARIFRKRDNAFMMDILLPFSTEQPVSYTQPECSNGNLITSKLTYTNTVTLSDSRFGDPEGYYIVWERCCRNYSITNIISREPPVGVIDYADAAGQTFYLEFPPVVKDGVQFINSSPRLFPPLSDYACPNKHFYADFAGTDDDGDSLVYSLTTPLNTHTAQAIPPTGPSPAPYPLVRWQTGFGLDKITKGSPDLQISEDGFLTVHPTIQGLFVFAVKCEEFRDGVKIGELRRDFQMLVVDDCSEAVPPVITGKTKSSSNYSQPGQPLTVTFPNTVSDENRCIDVRVSDADAFRQQDGYQEKVRIKAIPIGFKKDISGILPSNTSAILTPANPYFDFEICFEDCPYKNGPFQVGIVAYDDACSLPLFDTLVVNVDIEPPPNNKARFTTPNVDETLMEGDIRSWPVRGVDDDGDALVVGLITDGFALTDYGMKLTQIKNVNGEYEAKFDWDTRCDVYNFTQRSQFEVKILLDDLEQCSLFQPDTMVLKLKVILPENKIPIIDTNLTPDAQEIIVTDIKRKVNESLSFNVSGIGGDGLLVLDVQGKDFDIHDYTITFPRVTGYSNVLSIFNWDILCDDVDLEVKDEFTFQFTVVDPANRCQFIDADVVEVVVKVEPPDNNGPDLEIRSLDAAMALISGAMQVTLGQQITLGLSGIDPDNTPQPDMLHLELIEATGTVPPEGYIFAPAEGRGAVSTTFTWKPECNIFQNGVYENDYTFTFRVVDDRCFNSKGDTVDVDIKIKDVESGASEFLPPNFISPNGDGLNDFFAMVKLDENSGELVSILPKDNCSGHFQGITIYNRWGRQVFESITRDFRWYALDEASGMYYYTLEYSNKEYKGIITVSYGESQSNR